MFPLGTEQTKLLNKTANVAHELIILITQLKTRVQLCIWRDVDCHAVMHRAQPDSLVSRENKVEKEFLDLM